MIFAVNLNESFDVTPAKLAALKSLIARLGIQVALIEEAFVRGSGKGGQKINKTSNCVQLYYPPLDIRVRCQRERKRSLNRFLALRELAEQAEMKVSPATSKRLQEQERIRRRKSRRQERSHEKYGAPLS